MNMIISKTEKHLYSFLKDVFNIMGKSSSSKFLFGDDNNLYFSTFYIKGMITLEKERKSDQSLYEFGNKFYTLKMLDDKSYELKEKMNMAKTAEEEAALQKDLVTLFAQARNICQLETKETAILSILTSSTFMRVPDRFLGLMSKMNDCDVLLNDTTIILKKQVYYPKDEIDVTIKLAFDCSYDQPKSDD